MVNVIRYEKVSVVKDQSQFTNIYTKLCVGWLDLSQCVFYWLMLHRTVHLLGNGTVDCAFIGQHNPGKTFLLVNATLNCALLVVNLT